MLAPNQDNHPVVGIIALVSGLFVFAIQDVIIKQFSAQYSVLQLVIVRGIVAVIAIGIIVAIKFGPSGFRVYQPLRIGAKGFLAFFSYLAYYLAIASLPLADVVTITFSAPIMVVLLSSLLVGEPVGLRRWLTTLSGFTGVLIAVGFEGHLVNIATAFAFLAALTYALNSIMARYISARDNPWTVTFYFSVTHFAGGLLSYLMLSLFPISPQTGHPSFDFLFREWQWSSPVDVAIMASLGLVATAGFYCLNKAYLMARAATVAPFEYSYVIWAVLFGYLFWEEIPAAATVLGLLIMIGSNLFALRSEIIKIRTTD
tara:strand:+ start:2441 stop:3385 length:945 start_codon:yes stop_codon:yes gene_type:complete